LQRDLTYYPPPIHADIQANIVKAYDADAHVKAYDADAHVKAYDADAHL
jgi:hypothetical protein